MATLANMHNDYDEIVSPTPRAPIDLSKGIFKNILKIKPNISLQKIWRVCLR